MALYGGKHIMLSYNHKSKDIVCKVYEKLTEAGIPTWMDTKGGMGDNPKRSMAKGVEDASVVCCFLTQDYQNSDACEEELTYASVKKKRIIPCMASDRKVWKPSGWLGILTTKLLYIDFYNLSEVDFNKRVSELIDRITNQSLDSMEKSLSLSKNLFDKIKQKYLQENRIKRLVNEEKSFSIEQSYINLSVVETKEQHEKEKKLNQSDSKPQEGTNKQNTDTILGTYEEIYGIKTSIEVENIFERCKDHIKKVLMLGRAGIGKSTFCQYVTYRWAKGEIWSQYDLVVLIRLRKLTDNDYPSGKNYSPMDLIQNEYFPFSDLSNEDRQYFEDMCNINKVLWILDGYDEFAQNIPKQLKRVSEHILKTQHHILTSRPYAGALPYEVKMEIIGFTNDNIPKYVENFYDQLKDEVSNACVEGQKLLKFIESNSSIWGIAHIPVNLELICSLWGDSDSSKKKILTMTGLYDNITEWLCRRHLTKQDIEHEHMKRKKIYDQCIEELRFLETLAFNAMEDHKIILPPDLIEQTEEETECSLDEHPKLLNFGILKSYDDRPTGNQIQAEKQYYFIHLSFQEYFAARHLLQILSSLSKEKAINFINNHKYNRRFLYVFIFASGLLAQSEYKSCAEVFWTTIQEEPLDLVGVTHLKLVIECLDELAGVTVFRQSADYLHLVLQSLDICIKTELSAVRDSLLQSFARTNFLCNNSKIQLKLIQLLDNDENAALRTICRIISKLPISIPIEKLISQLVGALTHQDRGVRQHAFEALEQMGEKAATNEVITCLVNALRDGNTNIREYACMALGKIGEKAATTEVISSLMNALRDDALSVRRCACVALGKIGEKVATSEVIICLINALRDGDSNVRQSACGALGNMSKKVPTNEVIIYFINALHDENSYVRQSGCNALGKMGEKAATNEVTTDLSNALRDQDYNVRQCACEALGKMGERSATNEVITGLIDALGDEFSDVRQHACSTLGEMGEKAATTKVITALINTLRDDISHVGQSACNALGKMDEKVATTEMIIRFANTIDQVNSDVRRCARETFRKVSEKAVMNEVIPNLIDKLHDENYYVRKTACEVLGEMGEKVATTEVVTNLINAVRDKDWQVRLGAHYALRKICEKATTNEVTILLINALSDGNSHVRKCACEALGAMGKNTTTVEMITGLIDTLGDEDSDVRRSACRAIGEISEKYTTTEVIACLIKAFRDQDGIVRQHACEALEQIAEKSATNEVITCLINALHDEDSYVRRYACKAFGKMGKNGATNEIIVCLINVLRDKDWNVRECACKALGKMGGKAATNEVITGLTEALGDKFSGVRQSACGTLGQMGEKAATNEVINKLSDALRDEFSNVRRFACRALEQMGEKGATTEVITGLINALRDKDFNVRYDACDALGKMGEKATTTEVLVALISNFPGKLNADYNPVTSNAFERVICSFRGMSQLNSQMICQLAECIRQNGHIKLTKIPSNHLIKVYFETENAAWLPLVTYVALVQGVAIAVVENNIRIYHMNEVEELSVSRPELIETLIKAFKDQQEALSQPS